MGAWNSSYLGTVCGNVLDLIIEELQRKTDPLIYLSRYFSVQLSIFIYNNSMGLLAVLYALLLRYLNRVTSYIKFFDINLRTLKDQLFYLQVMTVNLCCFLAYLQVLQSFNTCFRVNRLLPLHPSFGFYVICHVQPDFGNRDQPGWVKKYPTANLLIYNNSSKALVLIFLFF